MTKVDIMSGFLGAGKTTLIKKLLKEAFAGEKVVLIENEFGEIGIDGGFLKEAGVQITEMNSGCICCSLVGDFGKALKEVVDTYHPDRVIIEPSGVGKLSDVIVAVDNVMSEDMVLNSFTAVVDGLKCKMYMKNFGEFFNNQVESAKTIVISRSQKMPQAKLDECVALLREHNEDAAIITTPWEELDGKKILEAMEKKENFEEDLLSAAIKLHEEHEHEHHHHHEDGECCCGHHHDEEHEHHHHHEDGECCCGHHHDEEHEHHHHHEDGECCCGHHHDEEHEHHHHHHADDVFTSWGKETPRKYTEEEIEEALKVLADTTEVGAILRAKGMVPNVNGEWIFFDLVPGEYEIRKGTPEYTGRLCVIGTDLKEDKIMELFHLN